MANLKFNPNKLSSLISGGASILDTSLDLAEINDNYQDDITQVRNQPFSPSGTYSLMNQFNNMNWGSNKTLHDFTGKTGADYAKGILGATATGAMAGKTFGPIGAAVGAGVGLIGGSIGAISNYINGNNALDRYRHELSEAREFALRNADSANNELKTNMFNDSLRTFYRSSAYGGELNTHGSDFSNNVKYINTGGTHEQNPNGGVLMGIDEEGTPNFVEEGEVIVGDYVFSNRMKPSQSALEKAHLDPSLYGGSYAEVAEAIARKSEEMPNDPISKRTLNSNLSRLMSVQEDARARKAERESNQFSGGGKIRSTGTTWFYNGHAFKSEEEAQRYYDAVNSTLEITGNNSIGYTTSDGKTFPNRIVARRHAKQLADGVWAQFNESTSLEKELELQRPIPGNSTNATTINPTSVTSSGEPVGASGQTAATVEAAENTTPASGIKDTIRDGNIIRPDLENARVGNGQIPYDRAQNGEEFENQQYYQDFLNYMRENRDSQEAQDWINALNAGNFGSLNGYNINSFNDWERLATDKKVGPVHTATLNAASNWANTIMANRAINQYDLEPPVLINGPGAEVRDKNGIIRDTIKNNPLEDQPVDNTTEEPQDDGIGAYLRYAPVVGNALALLGNRKDYSDVNRFETMTANPRTVRFSPIGSYITPNLVAPSELSTPINNQMNAERNYIRNNSVGNSTAANNYALASDYLGNSRIGTAYLQGKQYNSDQRQRASAYNLGIDEYNSEGAFREQQVNMGLNNYYLNRALQSYQMRNNIDMAYNQARSSNLTAMFNNLGNIGLDTFNRNRSNQVYPYRNSGWLGDILYNG